MFQFPRFAYFNYVFIKICHIAVTGCPIQTPPDHRLFASSPKLFAGYHVFLRLWLPRHPPYAFSFLIISLRTSFPMLTIWLDLFLSLFILRRKFTIFAVLFFHKQIELIQSPYFRTPISFTIILLTLYLFGLYSIVKHPSLFIPINRINQKSSLDLSFMLSSLRLLN